MKSALTPSLINFLKFALGFFAKKSSNLSALKPSKLTKRTGLIFFEATDEFLTKNNKKTRIRKLNDFIFPLDSISEKYFFHDLFFK